MLMRQKLKRQRNNHWPEQGLQRVQTMGPVQAIQIHRHHQTTHHWLGQECQRALLLDSALEWHQTNHRLRVPVLQNHL